MRDPSRERPKGGDTSLFKAPQALPHGTPRGYKVIHQKDGAKVDRLERRQRVCPGDIGKAPRVTERALIGRAPVYREKLFYLHSARISPINCSSYSLGEKRAMAEASLPICCSA